MLDITPQAIVYHPCGLVLQFEKWHDPVVERFCVAMGTDQGFLLMRRLPTPHAISYGLVRWVRAAACKAPVAQLKPVMWSLTAARGLVADADWHRDGGGEVVNA